VAEKHVTMRVSAMPYHQNEKRRLEHPKPPFCPDFMRFSVDLSPR
jgi:hypothetical protein